MRNNRKLKFFHDKGVIDIYLAENQGGYSLPKVYKSNISIVTRVSYTLADKNDDSLILVCNHFHIINRDD